MRKTFGAWVGTMNPSSAGVYYTPSRDAIVLALDSANPKAAYHGRFTACRRCS